MRGGGRIGFTLRRLALVGGLAGCGVEGAFLPDGSTGRVEDAPGADFDAPPLPDAREIPDALIQPPHTVRFAGAVNVTLELTISSVIPADGTDTAVQFSAATLPSPFTTVEGSLILRGAPEQRSYASSELVPALIQLSTSDGRTWQAKVDKPSTPPVGAIGPLTIESVLPAPVPVDGQDTGPAIYELGGELDASLAPTGAGTANFVSVHVIL
jgi:hypothetical protein